MASQSTPATDVSTEDHAKGERTRQRIIESACGLFLRVGYHGTSMREIAQAAQLALGSIYNHFATKDQIFAAVLEAYHPWREMPAAVASARGDTAEGLVRDAARRLLAAWGEHSDLVLLHSIEQLEFQGQHLRKLYETTAAQLTQTAQQRVATQTIPISLLERTLFGLFFAYQASEQFNTAALPIELGQSAVGFFTDVYLQGLLGPARAAIEKSAKAAETRPAKTMPAAPTSAQAKPTTAPSGRKWH